MPLAGGSDVAKNRSVRIEEVENGFVVRTEQKVELPATGKAEGVLYPQYDWKSEEHVAKTIEDASKIASDFMGVQISQE
jgi:hypothetical protein